MGNGDFICGSDGAIGLRMVPPASFTNVCLFAIGALVASFSLEEVASFLAGWGEPFRVLPCGELVTEGAVTRDVSAISARFLRRQSLLHLNRAREMYSPWPNGQRTYSGNIGEGWGRRAEASRTVAHSVVSRMSRRECGSHNTLDAYAIREWIPNI